MAYQKQIWENLPSTNTPLNADRLNHIEDGIADAWEHGGGGGGDTLPIGIILPLSSDTIPEGYLLCDGSEISRTTYSTLFSVIGTTYGAGDGSTTFNIPDLQGKVPVGQDTNDTDFDALGETGGGKQTIIPMQWYTEFIDMRIKTGLNIPEWENFRKSVNGQTGRGILETSNSGVMGVNENTTVETNGNLQPYLTVKYIIKALNAQSGEVRSESLPVGTELDYDGETVPTGWEQIPQKEFIIATTTTASRTNPTKVVFNSVFSYVGGFTLNDGGVVIPAGISKVRVSANIFFEDAQTTGYSICAIYLSRNGTETNQGQTITPISSGFFASSTITPTIIDVEEGDIIYIKGDNPSNSKVRINRANTWILIEKYV